VGPVGHLLYYRRATNIFKPQFPVDRGDFPR